MIDFILMFLLLGVLLFFIGRFIYTLMRLEEKAVFPMEKDVESVWLEANKPVDGPSRRQQKKGITFYSLLHGFVAVMFAVVWLFHSDPVFMTYMLVTFPLFFTKDILNVFMISEGGVLAGARFVSWKWLKHYDVIKIDVNHKFYGHSPEVNDQYEIKIHSKWLTQSCIVTSDETRDRLIELLQKKGLRERVNSLVNTVYVPDGNEST